jgi:inorganic phosphate transporter, PiT family
MMLGVSLASFMFIMTSSLFSMPISGTHTVVGAVIGAGIVGAGSNQVGWAYMINVVLSWIISPLLTMCLSFLNLWAVSYLTLGGPDLLQDSEVQERL